MQTCVTASRPLAGLAHGPSPRRPRLAPVPLRGAPVRFKERDEQEEVDVMREELRKGLPKSLADVQRMMAATGKARDLAPRPGLLQPAFTRPREIVVGRIAMVGFFAACLWETVLPGHPGILSQLSAATGVSPGTWATGLLVLITWNIIGALAPWSPTYSQYNLMDAAQRPMGPPAVWVNPLTDPKRFFGVTGWGFTKANELAHGRLAMIGFAAALINQMRLGGYSGPGPLAQIAHYLGVQDVEGFFMSVPSVFLAWAVFATTVAFIAGRPGSVVGEEDVY